MDKPQVDIIAQMRHYLQPKGTAPIVVLRTESGGIWLNHSFVSACIDELERMPMRAVLGEGPSKLEQLAYMLLCDAAYVDNKNV